MHTVPHMSIPDILKIPIGCKAARVLKALAISAASQNPVHQAMYSNIRNCGDRTVDMSASEDKKSIKVAWYFSRG